MIIFKTLKWKNFLSTGNYFTKINLNSNVNTLVVGENGSGKSTMLDALCFGLFGKAFRRINKSQLVNSINLKDCVIEIDFLISERKFKIVRGIKPNIFEIYCDGNLVSQDASVRDYQEHLEKFILKLNYKSFTQVVILGSASFTPFMQLSASDRRNIIENILDIQIFSVMHDILKKKISSNKESITENKHGIQLANQEYDLHKKYLKDFKENNEQKIKEFNKEITNSAKIITSLSKKITLDSKKITTLSTKVTKKIETENKIKKIEKLESKIESKISSFEHDIHFLHSNDDCPTCKQSISKEFKEKELSDLSSKKTECESGLEKISSELTKYQTTLGEIQTLQSNIHTLQMQVAVDTNTVSEKKKYIKKMQKEIKEIQSLKNDKDSEENKLKNVKEKISNLNKFLEDLLDEKTYNEAVASLLKDDGIKRKIVKQYLPIINKLVNKYLSTLDFFVNFTLDESFKETIKSRHRDDFSYDSFSEGEKQRIDMALMLTWRAIAKMKNSASTNLLILDEIFDSSLDVNGTDELMEILSSLEDVNLFVISHKGDILQDKFTEVLNFEKRGDFSIIKKS
tara:strand:+ start:3831 stop:5546 length:1716 start_codon:yes stop_codon:yes gene_type:complete